MIIKNKLKTQTSSAENVNTDLISSNPAVLIMNTVLAVTGAIDKTGNILSDSKHDINAQETNLQNMQALYEAASKHAQAVKETKNEIFAKCSSNQYVITDDDLNFEAHGFSDLYVSTEAFLDMKKYQYKENILGYCKNVGYFDKDLPCCLKEPITYLTTLSLLFNKVYDLVFEIVNDEFAICVAKALIDDKYGSDDSSIYQAYSNPLLYQQIECAISRIVNE